MQYGAHLYFKTLEKKITILGDKEDISDVR
jgi:hypothetical protein